MPTPVEAAIWPRGVLLAIGPDGYVAHASANAESLVGKPAQDLVGMALEDALGRQVAKEVRARLSHWGSPDERYRIEGRLRRPGGPVHVHIALHREPTIGFGTLILEIEESDAPIAVELPGTRAARSQLAASMAAAPTLDEAAAVMAWQMRHDTSCDEGIAIRYETDGTATIVGHEAGPGAPSLLGVRLPPETRALISWADATHNRVRLVDEVDAPQVAIVPGDGLDLRDADLQVPPAGVVELLRRINATSAAMIVLDGPDEPWGVLVSINHNGRMMPTYGIRSSAYESIYIISSRLTELMLEQRARDDERLAAQLRRYESLVAQPEQDSQADGDRWELISTIVDCEGAFGYLLHEPLQRGLHAVDPALMASWLADKPTIYATSSLAADEPELAALLPGVAGILVAQARDSHVVWWRRAERPGIRCPTADGAPDPREWCRPWTTHDKHSAHVLRDAGLRAMLEAAQRDLRSAEVLQRSLLHRPAQPAGWAIDTHYRPSSGGPLGGDWYDVFARPDGSVACVVGDVGGHGLHSAIAMAQLSNMLRGFLLDGQTPSDALASLGRVAGYAAPDDMATAFVAVVEPDSGHVTCASAGHLPPLLVDADGGTAFVELAPGPPIGTGAWFGQSSHFEMRPGSTLVGYTDGLVESRRITLDEGMSALRNAWPRAAHSPWPAEALVDAIAFSTAEDDVCVLVVHRGE